MEVTPLREVIRRGEEEFLRAVANVPDERIYALYEPPHTLSAALSEDFLVRGAELLSLQNLLAEPRSIHEVRIAIWHDWQERTLKAFESLQQLLPGEFADEIRTALIQGIDERRPW